MPSANNRHRACHGLLRTPGRHPEAIGDISCNAPESPDPGRGQKRTGAQALERPWALGGGSPRGSGERLPGRPCPGRPGRAGPGKPGPGRGSGAPSGDLLETTFVRISPQYPATFWGPFWAPKRPLGHPKRSPKGRLLRCLGGHSWEGHFKHPSQLK